MKTPEHRIILIPRGSKRQHFFRYNCSCGHAWSSAFAWTLPCPKDLDN